MPLICPVCLGAAENLSPTTRHAHKPQAFRHADDHTILCLVMERGEAVPARPVVAK